MKKIVFHLLLAIYSCLMSWIITSQVDSIFFINVVIFYGSAYFTYLVVKFLTEIIENRIEYENYFKISLYWDKILLINLFARMALFFLNFNDYISAMYVASAYFVLNIVVLIVTFILIKRNDNTIEMNAFKNIAMVLPILVYFVLDFLSFRGGLR